MNTLQLVLTIGGIVIGWLTRAAIDGKITSGEIEDLVQECVTTYEHMTGKSITIDLPGTDA